jgi:hypothetical protein
MGIRSPGLGEPRKASEIQILFRGAFSFCLQIAGGQSNTFCEIFRTMNEIFLKMNGKR